MQRVQEGSGCGSVGKEIASDTRGPSSNSVMGKHFIMVIFSVKTKIKRQKEAGNRPFLTKHASIIWGVQLKLTR